VSSSIVYFVVLGFFVGVAVDDVALCWGSLRA
jgi:hypothetical protein